MVLMLFTWFLSGAPAASEMNAQTQYLQKALLIKHLNYNFPWEKSSNARKKKKCYIKKNNKNI